ncbi:hypothetical protein WJX81_000702 [Elliptochloris bilobata]|uniref:Uncharacterized protein n=1 Tax=Elliptochloris bilobata TaxID=381761 RepID=A0AAW1S797_9CHLO
MALWVLLAATRPADAQQSGQALAPSPGDAAARQASDGSFTLGPCANATLLNSTYLRMEGVPSSVSWLQLAPAHTAGTLPTANFTNVERGAGSEWLGRHQASLFGTVNGNSSVVALTLSSPSYSAAAERLEMRYEVLEAETAVLPLAGGTVNGIMGNYQAGVSFSSPTFLVSPDAGTVFDTATLVIDTLNTSELAVGNKVGTKADVIYVIPIGRR